MIRDMKKQSEKSAEVNKYFFLLTIFLFLIRTVDFYSQDEGENQAGRIDSIKRFQGIIPPVEFQYNFDAIFSKPITSQVAEEILFDDNPSTIWLRTELFMSNQAAHSGVEEAGTYFTSVLYHQYLKDAEFNMVRYVLGIAQTSAAAYIAYRHIKKYGFWK